jgi:hypothetical protein
MLGPGSWCVKRARQACDVRRTRLRRPSGKQSDRRDPGRVRAGDRRCSPGGDAANRQHRQSRGAHGLGKCRRAKRFASRLGCRREDRSEHQIVDCTAGTARRCLADAVDRAPHQESWRHDRAHSRPRERIASQVNPVPTSTRSLTIIRVRKPRTAATHRRARAARSRSSRCRSRSWIRWTPAAAAERTESSNAAAAASPAVN